MSDTLDMTELNSADDVKGYDYPLAGGYHLAVSEVDASREKSNAVFVTFTVLAGKPDGQQNKVFRERFADPSKSHKDEGKFALKRQVALLLATGVLTPADLGKKVNVDWNTLLERQLKAMVKNYDREDKDDKNKRHRGAEIDGLSMWGPCDADAHHIPANDICLDVARKQKQSNVPATGGARQSAYSNV
jgi:hypothetical protein